MREAMMLLLNTKDEKYFEMMMRMLMGVVIVLCTASAQAAPTSATGDDAEVLADESACLSFEYDPGDVTIAGGGNDPFAKGSWQWHVYGGGTFGDNNGEAYSTNIGVGYYYTDNMSVNVDAAVMWGNGNEDDVAVGVGFELIFRWHFYRSKRWSMYGEVGGGVVGFEQNFPPGGTKFNFTAQGGIGATYQFDTEMMLILGVRWYHISNGRIQGTARNIGYDGVGVYFGVMRPF